MVSGAGGDDDIGVMGGGEELAAPPRPAAVPPAEEAAEPTLPQVLTAIERKYGSFQPRVQVERDHEDPQSLRAVFLRGGVWGPPGGLDVPPPHTSQHPGMG